MDTFTCWLPLVLVTFTLTKSDVAPVKCNEFSGQNARESNLRRGKEMLAALCYEYLQTETNISEAILRSQKLPEDECKFKLQQSDCVISNLKATIDDLTKTVESLNQTVQLLCGQLKNVCRDLIEAAKSGNVNTVKTLFKCTKDNCTTDDWDRYTPLIFAAINGHVEVVRVLLDGGANLDGVNAYGQTALHFAAFNGHLDVCRLLLDWGAKVDTPSKDAQTPMHSAALKGHLQVVKLLVEKGADVGLKNNVGDTPSDMARKLGYKDVAIWLDKEG